MDSATTPPPVGPDSPEEIVSAILRSESDLPEAKRIHTVVIDSPIGALFTAADDEGIYLLHEVRKFGLQRKVATLHSRVECKLVPGGNRVLDKTTDELKAYFAGELREFGIPLHLTGTAFQNTVWGEICSIPYGATMTYAAMAERIGKPSSFRAVAQALALNPILIMVPCHRVVNADGSLGGYAGGPNSKEWLLELERKNLENAPGRGKNDGDPG